MLTVAFKAFCDLTSVLLSLVLGAPFLLTPPWLLGFRGKHIPATGPLLQMVLLPAMVFAQDSHLITPSPPSSLNANLTEGILTTNLCIPDPFTFQCLFFPYY